MLEQASRAAANRAVLVPENLVPETPGLAMMVPGSWGHASQSRLAASRSVSA